MTKQPKHDRIFLQVCEDSMSENFHEVTWCQDRVHDDDIEYIRADLVAERLAAMDAVLKQLEWCKSYSYCTGWPSCPICRGIKPGEGRDENGTLPDNQGHRKGCELANGIEKELGK
jgi:hypothetical protein